MNLLQMYLQCQHFYLLMEINLLHRFSLLFKNIKYKTSSYKYTCLHLNLFAHFLHVLMFLKKSLPPILFLLPPIPDQLPKLIISISHCIFWHIKIIILLIKFNILSHQVISSTLVYYLCHLLHTPKKLF